MREDFFEMEVINYFVFSISASDGSESEVNIIQSSLFEMCLLMKLFVAVLRYS